MQQSTEVNDFHIWITKLYEEVNNIRIDIRSVNNLKLAEKLDRKDCHGVIASF